MLALPGGTKPHPYDLCTSLCVCGISVKSGLSIQGTHDVPFKGWVRGTPLQQPKLVG